MKLKPRVGKTKAFPSGLIVSLAQDKVFNWQSIKDFALFDVVSFTRLESVKYSTVKDSPIPPRQHFGTLLSCISFSLSLCWKEWKLILFFRATGHWTYFIKCLCSFDVWNIRYSIRQYIRGKFYFFTSITHTLVFQNREKSMS